MTEAEYSIPSNATRRGKCAWNACRKLAILRLNHSELSFCSKEMRFCSTVLNFCNVILTFCRVIPTFCDFILTFWSVIGDYITKFLYICFASVTKICWSLRGVRWCPRSGRTECTVLRPQRLQSSPLRFRTRLIYKAKSDPKPITF